MKIFRIASLFTGIAILLLSCENEIQKIKAFSAPENLPIVSVIDFESTYTDSFKIQFFIKAPLLQKFESDEGQPYIDFPNGVILVKYDSDEKIISKITSDYAKQYEKDKKWEAKNNVIAINANKDTLKTEYLVWEEKKQKIYTDKFVEIIRENQIITGTGFESDQNLQNWRIKKIKATLYLDVKSKDSSTDKIQSSTEKKDNGLKPIQLSN